MATNINAFLKPAADTVGTLYTATGKEIISTISVSNTGSALTTFTIYYVPSGESVGVTYAFPNTANIAGYNQIDFTRAITLSSGDTIQVKSLSGDCTFALFGQST